VLSNFHGINFHFGSEVTSQKFYDPQELRRNIIQ